VNRIGKACALQWGDLDVLNRFIEVRRTYSNGRIEEAPKSSKSRRVDMSQQLTEALKALLLERKRETLRKGWGEASLGIRQMRMVHA
jgi:integrase